MTFVRVLAQKRKPQSLPHHVPARLRLKPLPERDAGLETLGAFLQY